MDKENAGYTPSGTLFTLKKKEILLFVMTWIN